MVGRIHGLMPRNNPILGSFQHAPSAANARSKYFKAEMVSESEYERMKALRHNPFTGQFHSGPRQFSTLHGLKRFRESKQQEFCDMERSESSSDTSSLSSTDSSRGNHKRVGSEDVSHGGAELRKLETYGRGAYSNPPSPVCLTRSKSASQEFESSWEVPEQPSPVLRKRCHSSSNPAATWRECLDSVGGKSDKDMDKSKEVKPWRIPAAEQSARPRSATADHNKPKETAASKYNVRRFGSVDATVERPVQVLSDETLSFDLSASRSTSPSLASSASLTSLGSLAANGTGSAIGFVESEEVDEDPHNPWIVNRTEEITGKYKIDMTKAGCLGKGAYSLAKVALNRQTKTAYCVKIVKKRLLVTKEEKEMIKREVEIHQVMRHPHIIRLTEIFEDENRLFLVMERANGGNLEQLLGLHGGRLPEAHCQHIFKQLIQGIHHLHENGVLQGDLKPANILLNRKEDGTETTHPFCAWEVKLCDFGLSRKVPYVKYYRITGDVHKVPFTNLCGTMGYMAPEILRREDYTIAADIWSAGIILYEMLSGIRPFVPYQDCLSVPLSFPDLVFGNVSSAAVSLTERMLTLDVTSRITARQAIRDEWIENSIPTLFSCR